MPGFGDERGQCKFDELDGIDAPHRSKADVQRERAEVVA